MRKQLRYISIVDRIQLKTGDVFRFVQGLEVGGGVREGARGKFEVARTREARKELGVARSREEEEEKKEDGGGGGDSLILFFRAR